VLWLMFCASRSVTEWMAIFGFGSFGSLTPEQYLEGSPLDRNVYLAFTLLGIIILAKRPRIRRLLLANLPVLLFFSYCALSVLWSDFPDVTFKRWFKAVGDLVMVLIVLTELDQIAATKRWFGRVGFVLLPLSVLFMKYIPELGRDFHPNGPGAAWEASYTGVTGSKNLLGMLTLLIGIASEWCFLQAFRERRSIRKNGPLIAHGILLGVVIWLMQMAQSATALSCLLMGAGLITLTGLHRLGRKPMVVSLYCLGAVSVSLFALFADSGGGLLGTLGRDPTLTGRTDIWKLALGMAGNPLVGTGFESFWLGARVEKTWDAYRFHLQESHNGYVELYLTLGWIGIALFATLLVTGCRNLLAAFRHNPQMGSLKLAFFLVGVVYSLTEVGFRTQNPMWIVLLWAVIAVPKTAIPKWQPAPEAGQADHLTEREPQVDFAAIPGFGRRPFETLR
jgi:exopolysaccharide production protein ExoQ